MLMLHIFWLKVIQMSFEEGEGSLYYVKGCRHAIASLFGCSYFSVIRYSVLVFIVCFSPAHIAVPHGSAKPRAPYSVSSIAWHIKTIPMLFYFFRPVYCILPEVRSVL